MKQPPPEPEPSPAVDVDALAREIDREVARVAALTTEALADEGRAARAKRNAEDTAARIASGELRPPRGQRPRCLAYARSTGRLCAAPVVWRQGEPPRARCRMHGGADGSGVAKTPEGHARKVAAGRANLARGNARRHAEALAREALAVVAVARLRGRWIVPGRF